MLRSVNFKPLALVISLILGLSACSESTSSSNGSAFKDNSTDNGGDNKFDESALLVNLVDNVITPTYIAFNEQAKKNTTTLSSYCDVEKSVAAGESSEDSRLSALESAQSSWRITTALWQHAEMMQVGPLTDNEGDLRNLIYSWPAKSSCGVDQDTVYFEDGYINKDTSRAYSIKERTATRRGLVSLEYLLFNAELDHSCTIANDALMDWNSRTDSARRIARCEYALEVSRDLVDNSQVLLDKWSGESGFASELKGAGQNGNRFESVHAAVNLISDAMFYTDKQLKDYKLATPLGYFSNSCGLEACPEDVESPIAKNSLQNLKANLEAFEKLFTGNGNAENDTTGFDDFLDFEGGSDIKESILAGIKESNAAIDAINGDMKQALVNEKAKVELTHTKVKNVTDQLKNDFINKLALELPKTSAGDND